MIWIVLAAGAGALFAYLMLRQNGAIKTESLDNYQVVYEKKRKVRSDKGKKRGPYKKGVK